MDKNKTNSEVEESRLTASPISRTELEDREEEKGVQEITALNLGGHLMMIRV